MRTMILPLCIMGKYGQPNPTVFLVGSSNHANTCLKLEGESLKDLELIQEEREMEGRYASFHEIYSPRSLEVLPSRKLPWLLQVRSGFGDHIKLLQALHL